MAQQEQPQSTFWQKVRGIGATVARKTTGLVSGVSSGIRSSMRGLHGAPSAAEVAAKRASAMSGMDRSSLLEVDFDTGDMVAYKINPAGQKSVEARGPTFEALKQNYLRQEPFCGTPGRPGPTNLRSNGTQRHKVESSIVRGKYNCKGGKSRKGRSRRNDRKTRRN